MIKLLARLLAPVFLCVAVPAFAQPPITAYTLPDIDRISLSPSGERFAIQGRFDNAPRILIVEDGQVLRAIAVDDDKIRGLGWAGDDKLLITSSLTNEDYSGEGQLEISQMGILDISEGTLTSAFSRGTGENSIWGVYGFGEVDGVWYGYLGGMEMEGNFPRTGKADLFRVNLDDGRPELIERGGRGDRTRSWFVDKQGGIIARTERNSRTGEWRLLIGDETVLEIDDPLGDHGLVGFGRDRETLIYRALEEGEEKFYALDVSDPQAPGERVFADLQEGAGFITHPDTRVIIGTYFWRDRPRISFFDETLQTRQAALRRAFPDLDVILTDWSDDMNQWIFLTEGDTDSGTYWLVDFETGETNPIGKTYQQVTPEWVGPMRTVTYEAQDGTEIEAFLTLPPGREAVDLPVVMLPHGGPEAHDVGGFDWLAQIFASRGYAVLQPNFRGSDGYGEAFVEAGHGQWGLAMQTDVSDGLAWLVEQGIADPDRACVFGASYGGYVAMAAVTLQQDIYRCAVAYAGVSNLQIMVNYSAENGGRGARRYWDDYMGGIETRRAVSPERFASDANGSLMLIHGRDDTVVPLEQSEMMEQAMRRAGKDVELLVLDGEDHWLSTPGARTETFEAAVEFIEQENPPD